MDLRRELIQIKEHAAGIIQETTNFKNGLKSDKIPG